MKTARELAHRAGLIDQYRKAPTSNDLIDWFTANLAPFLDKDRVASMDKDVADRELVTAEEYYDRRKERRREDYKLRHQLRDIRIKRPVRSTKPTLVEETCVRYEIITHWDLTAKAPDWNWELESRLELVPHFWTRFRSEYEPNDSNRPLDITNIAGVENVESGLWQYRWEGKLYRSQFSDHPFATPTQIAGQLIGKYGDVDIDIVEDHRTTSKSGGYAMCGGKDMPVYHVHVTRKMPNWRLTAEDLYLRTGQLLDEDAAKALTSRLEKALISRETYSEEIAKLCREAPVDPDWAQPVWTELDDKGNLAYFDMDDTRDASNDREPESTWIEEPCFTISDFGRPVFNTRRRKVKAANRFDWSDDSVETLAENDYMACAIRWGWCDAEENWEFMPEENPYIDRETSEDMEIDMLLGLDKRNLERSITWLGDNASALDLLVNTGRRRGTRIVNPADTLEF